MITAMAASSLPSLEADEEGGLFFLALRAPCIIWSLRVMLAFPLLLLWRCLCLQTVWIGQDKFIYILLEL